MSIRERISGNEAVAYAMRQINPDVFAAFPITPSTEIPQYFAQYVANGQVDTEYVTVESEHSSMSTCIGAEAAGCRAVTATSSCGLGITCTEISSPTRSAAAAPASVAAFTAPTSPRTITVTNPPPTCSLPIRVTFAAFTIASAASMEATSPFVSIIPSACVIAIFVVSLLIY